MMNNRKNNVTGNVDGIVKGLSELVDKLAGLAEQGDKLKRSGVFDVDTNSSKQAKAVYGFSIKMGLNENSEPLIEPFGNVHQDEKTGETIVHEVSEPLIDIIEEFDHILILAEMPGVSDDDIHLDLNGDILVLHAEKGSKKYHKEIILPRSFDSSTITRACHNGILELKLKV